MEASIQLQFAEDNILVFVGVPTRNGASKAQANLHNTHASNRSPVVLRQMPNSHLTTTNRRLRLNLVNTSMFEQLLYSGYACCPAVACVESNGPTKGPHETRIQTDHPI